MARHVEAKLQLDLFAPPSTSPPAVGAATVSPAMVALARHLPRQIYLGTSSWTFPGWHGLVYAYVRANYVRQKTIMLWMLQHGQPVTDPPRDQPGA